MGRLMLLAGRRLTRQGEIHLTAEASRSQEANRQAVLDRLRELLIAAMHRPRPRRKTRPSRASRQKRLNAKKHRGKIKSGRRGLED
jgi:ribosome-associated protein